MKSSYAQVRKDYSLFFVLAHGIEKDIPYDLVTNSNASGHFLDGSFSGIAIDY